MSDELKVARSDTSRKRAVSPCVSLSISAIIHLTPSVRGRIRGNHRSTSRPGPLMLTWSEGLGARLRLRLYEDPTTVLDVDVQVVPVQQRHPDEGRRIRRVGHDLS